MLKVSHCMSRPFMLVVTNLVKPTQVYRLLRKIQRNLNFLIFEVELRANWKRNNSAVTPRTSEEGKEFTTCSLISQCQGNGRQLLNGVQSELQREGRKGNPVKLQVLLCMCLLAAIFLISLAAPTELVPITFTRIQSATW